MYTSNIQGNHWMQLMSGVSKTVINHLTSKGSIALRAGRANARRCFGRYES
jgi:hypothetical protein|tara:strand:+ start:25268 stop:25420 length:153 start_codon:yes stop_codon:yes gene_type:complete